MTHASTFSGIGGAEVAADMMGWENLFHCEINPFGRKILDYHYPNSKSYEDITKTDFSEWRGRVDVLTGGFPCQPFSYAGKRRGAEDDRYLWPYMLRCIEQIRPTWFVGENVAGITTMALPGETAQVAIEADLFGEGYTYEKTSERFVLDEICGNLERIGYAVQPFIIPACSVGAPHRRDRIFFLAHNERDAPYHTHLRDDGAETRNASSTEGAQRVQERDNLRRPGGASQVRSEGDGTPQDPKAVRCGQREVQESQHTGNDCPASNERRAGYVAPHSDCGGEGASVKSGSTQGSGCHGDAESGERECKTQRTDGSLETPRYAPDSISEGLQARHCGCETCIKDGDTPSGNAGGDCKHSGCYGLPWCGLANNQRIHPDTERTLLQRWDCETQEGRETEEHGIEPLGEDSRRPTWCGDYLFHRWDSFPTVSPIHRGNDGLPFDVDCLAISASKWRTESLKAYGNAIVPQVMYEIFRAIEYADTCD